ncbi:hypothetical protein PROFUN_02903 [Planoprotostelium fungivorum]|uniref:THH1/TOM1/TOM3 domain-containing protein n=1 Tax=Planoprotostelium fungivorum TaxID=1890364 RepID=A0A2P6NS12_9EUKA|nr:hypothetical protein PROFUN_02903 [Planoprotostelium fungivorum]
MVGNSTTNNNLQIVNYITSDNEANEVLLFACAICYTVMGVAAAALLTNKIRTASPIRGEKPQKLYLSLLILFATFRSSFFWFLAICWARGKLMQISDGVWFIMLSLGSDLFSSTFIMLLYYWAKMYHFSKGGESISSVLILILNALLYLFQISEYLLFFYDSARATGRVVEVFFNIFTACFSLSLGFGLLLYSWKLYFMFGKSTSRTLTHGARFLSSIAGICMICFLVRATVLMTDAWILISPDAFVVLMFIVSEVVPSCLIMWVFRKPLAPLTGPSSIQPLLGSQNSCLNANYDPNKPALDHATTRKRKRIKIGRREEDLRYIE